MRKRLLSAVLAVAMLFGSAAALPQSAVVENTSVTASAYGEEKESGNYKYTILKDGTAKITKYNGKETKVTIPSKLGGIKVTRIAHGIPVGGDLEYTDEITLTKALEGRREI